MTRRTPRATLFPYTTLFRSLIGGSDGANLRALLTDTSGRPVWAGSSGANIIAAEPEESSEEHTSERQSLTNIVCRPLLEKKENTTWKSYSSCRSSRRCRRGE